MPGKLAVLGEESRCVLTGISTGALAVPPSKSLSLSCSDSCKLSTSDVNLCTCLSPSSILSSICKLSQLCLLRLKWGWVWGALCFRLDLHVHSTPPTSTGVLNSTDLYTNAQLHLPLEECSTPPKSTRALNSTYLYRSAQLHLPLQECSTPPTSTGVLNSTYLYRSAQLHLSVHVRSSPPTSTGVLNSTYLYRSAQLHLSLHVHSTPPTSTGVLNST